MDIPNTIPNIIIWLKKKKTKNGSHMISLRELEGNWARGREKSLHINMFTIH